MLFTYCTGLMLNQTYQGNNLSATEKYENAYVGILTKLNFYYETKFEGDASVDALVAKQYEALYKAFPSHASEFL